MDRKGEGREQRMKDLAVALLHFENSLRLGLRADTTDPTPRLHGPKRTRFRDDDRLRIILALGTVGEPADRFPRAHLVNGLSRVEGRGSPPGLGSSILLQPLRNHDRPEKSLHRDPPPLRLVPDPAQLMTPILYLEGSQLPHSEGAGSFAFFSRRFRAKKGLRSSLTSSDRESSFSLASRSSSRTSSVVLRAVQVFILAFIATGQGTMLIYKLDCASWPRASFRGRRDALAGLRPSSLRNGLVCVMDPVRAVHHRPLLVSLARGCSAQPARLVPVSPGGEKASAI